MAPPGENAFGRVKSNYLVNLALSAGMNVVSHPLTYVKVLIQVRYL